MTDYLKPMLARRVFLSGGIALGAGALAAGRGWADTTQPGAATPRRGGTVYMLINPEPSQLVTFDTSAGAEENVGPKLTEGLLWYDFGVNPHPQLAQSWEISTDGLRYTFRLRPNVRWHDGKEFTSQDVALSISLLKQYHPRGRATFANVQSVETPDALTAVLVLEKPAPYLLYALAASESPIVPAHIYGTGDPQQNPHNNSPIGTGPYRFVSWVRGSYIELERNPDYWDAPKPYIDKLILRVIPDAAARAVAFQNGELDIGGENPVPLPDIAALASSPHLAIDTNGYSYSPAQTQLEFNLDRPYVKELAVRQAIAHAINREIILRDIWYGYGVIAPGAVSPLLTHFNDPKVETYPFDPAKSNAILDAANFKRGGDGSRFALTLDYNPYDTNFLRVAQYVRQALAKIGISVTVRSLDFPAYVNRIYTDRDYDMELNFLSNTFDPTVGVQRIYWSKNFKKGLPFSNGSDYHNPQVDALLEQAAVEPNPAKRVQEFDAFQEIVAREIPLIDLVTLKQVTIYNKRVHDAITTADGIDGNLANVWVSS
jgi:peptide/nickel transport system substrate-binding protein